MECCSKDDSGDQGDLLSYFLGRKNIYSSRYICTKILVIAWKTTILVIHDSGHSTFIDKLATVIQVSLDFPYRELKY